MLLSPCSLSSTQAYIAGDGGKTSAGRKQPQTFHEPYGLHDVISCRLDFTHSTISFAKNGRDMRVAFTDLRGPVRPAVSFTGNGAAVQISSDFSALNPEGGFEFDLAGMSDGMILDSVNSVCKEASGDKWEFARGMNPVESGRVSFDFRIDFAARTSNKWGIVVGACPATFNPKKSKYVGSQRSFGWVGGLGEKVYTKDDGAHATEPYSKTLFGDTGDVITVTLDYGDGTIEFAKNGVSGESRLAFLLLLSRSFSRAHVYMCMHVPAMRLDAYGCFLLTAQQGL